MLLLTQLAFTLSQHTRENKDVQNLRSKTENKTSSFENIHLGAESKLNSSSNYVPTPLFIVRMLCL